MRSGTRTGGLAVFALAVGVMAIAGAAFVYKMAEFVVTIAEDEIAGFGAVAVATYLIGMLPIVFVTLWAALTGRFRDLERPKHRLLELDREIEAAEAARHG
jgi:nitrogen fixation-related uncharacterized protein